MNRSMQVLQQLLLTDSEGNTSQVVDVQGNLGAPYVDIITQSSEEVELGIATRHRVYTEEIERETT